MDGTARSQHVRISRARNPALVSGWDGVSNVNSSEAPEQLGRESSLSWWFLKRAQKLRPVKDVACSSLRTRPFLVLRSSSKSRVHLFTFTGKKRNENESSDCLGLLSHILKLNVKHFLRRYCSWTPRPLVGGLKIAQGRAETRMETERRIRTDPPGLCPLVWSKWRSIFHISEK